jgi:hypothetical protein
MLLNILFLFRLFFFAPAEGDVPKSIYDFKVSALEKGTIDFSKFKGKKILIVNTASECGNTPQYEQLEAMSKKYKGKLVILSQVHFQCIAVACFLQAFDSALFDLADTLFGQIVFFAYFFDGWSFVAFQSEVSSQYLSFTNAQRFQDTAISLRSESFITCHLYRCPFQQVAHSHIFCFVHRCIQRCVAGVAGKDIGDLRFAHVQYLGQLFCRRLTLVLLLKSYECFVGLIVSTDLILWQAHQASLLGKACSIDWRIHHTA